MATSKDTIKKKKRNWYEIHASKALRGAFLGETTVYAKEQVVGKRIKLNASTFTNDIKKQNIDAYFVVTTFTENKANAELIGVSLTNSYVKRLVRRGKTKIEDSFLARSKEGKVLRVKPIAITNSKTDKSITSRIRLELRAMMRKMLKETASEDFLADVLNQKFQREIKEVLSKIYPLKFIDIRQAVVDDKAVASSKNIDEESVAPKKQAKPKKKKKQTAEDGEDSEEESKKPSKTAESGSESEELEDLEQVD